MRDCVFSLKAAFTDWCFNPMAGSSSQRRDTGKAGVMSRSCSASILTEARIQKMKGQRIYVETSSREPYAPTHRFYQSCGYHQEGILKDFYAPGDDKIIYMKALPCH